MASLADQDQAGPASEAISMSKFGEKQRSKNQWRRLSKHLFTISDSLINTLDDGCLMHIFSFLSPLPDRYNTALVCHRWRFLACHPRLWLRVDRTIKDSSEPGVFSCIDAAVSAAKPGDTILIAAGGVHFTSNIQIKKPLCLIGGGELPEETTLLCSRGTDSQTNLYAREIKALISKSSPSIGLIGGHLGFCLLVVTLHSFWMQMTVLCVHCFFFLLGSALELLSTCKITNLTVKAELGCCLLHRSGRLIIDSCLLQCETDPLDYLSCPIVSTATGTKKLSSSSSLSSMSRGDGVTVSRTRIEGGAKAVLTVGTLVLQSVRVVYGRTSVLFWFEVEHQ